MDPVAPSTGANVLPMLANDRMVMTRKPRFERYLQASRALRTRGPSTAMNGAPAWSRTRTGFTASPPSFASDCTDGPPPDVFTDPHMVTAIPTSKAARCARRPFRCC